jgi:CBS domain-containing protein
MNERAFKYLSGMPHFSFLPKSELKKISDKTSFKSYPKDTLFAVQNKTKIDNIFVVEKGSLSLYDEKQEEKKLIGHIKPGEVFGGITILMNGAISLRTVIVDKDCSGYMIPKEDFLDYCTHNKSFYEYFVKNFSNHIFDDSLGSIISIGQAKHFLFSINPFSFLPEKAIEQAAAKLTMVQHPADTVLFVQERSRVGYLYILQKGSAERYYEKNHEKTMSEMLNEGDIYGGISMLVNDGISVRTFRVNEKSHFYLLPKKVFLDICSRYEAFSEYFTDIFGKRMLEKSYASIIAKTMQPEEGGLQFFNRAVSSINMKKPVFGDINLSIQDAAGMMSREKISSLFIITPDGECTGVLTEKDLTKKVIATGYDISRPVSDIMSSPVRTIPDQALIFEALMSMMEKNIRHLAVTDSSKKVTGILTNRDLLTAQGQSPVFLIREISAADSMTEIIDRYNKLPKQIRSLITGGAKAENLTRFITTVSDTILNKLIKYTIDELGAPPAEFVFMVLGSEGRREQTLKTDQDNAIIYEDVPKKDESGVNNYFLKFGKKVCTLLDQAGYAFCKGDVMAQNPKWCQPLSTWKKYFSSWIHAAEAEDLLQASIFFDFRPGYGNTDLIDSLRWHLLNSLGGWSGFFRHLTENALHFKPPLGFFRNFVVESKGKHRDAFDIKSAMTPIVDFARIYALKNKIEETNTLERLRQLNIKKVLSRQEYKEIERAYSFLLQLRLARQITSVIDEKAEPDNYIKPKALTQIEQKMLKEIFVRIEKFQSKLNFEFIGIA